VRISFAGGGSDYKEHYLKYGGAVLNATIDKYTYLSVRYLPPFFDFKHRIVYSRIEDVNDINEIQHPSVRECLKFMQVDRGIEINHAGDLPARSGIGSSSTFTVGLLNAIHTLQGKPISKFNLGMEAIHVEQDLIKENVGSQDQLAAACGGINLIEFDTRQPQMTRLNISRQRIKKLEERLILVFTGFQHNASEIAKTYNFKERTKELETMKGMARIAYALLLDNKLTEFGELLDEAWKYKKTLSDKITTPYTDYVYGLAKTAGAIGGKTCGAGGGGFMLLYAEPDKREDVLKALKGMTVVPFKFEESGSKVIVNNGAIG
jgi:D-glycero-alpha-D-manno-heptose-7-phosphate kinase